MGNERGCPRARSSGKLSTRFHQHTLTTIHTHKHAYIPPTTCHLTQVARIVQQLALALEKRIESNKAHLDMIKQITEQTSAVVDAQRKLRKEVFDWLGDKVALSLALYVS